MIVGITGGIGSGKSFVAKRFLEYNNTIYYHADEEAKKLINSSKEIKTHLIQEFGKESYTAEGKLDRSYISSIVFKNQSKLKALNSIVHPIVKKHFQKFIQNQNKETIVIYENAILFEIGSDQLCDIVVHVFAPKNERIKRVMQRDNVSEKSVLNRMKNQWSDEKKNMLSNYIIPNFKKEQALLKIQEIHNFLTKKIFTL